MVGPLPENGKHRVVGRGVLVAACVSGLIAVWLWYRNGKVTVGDFSTWQFVGGGILVGLSFLASDSASDSRYRTHARLVGEQDWETEAAADRNRRRWLFWSTLWGGCICIVSAGILLLA